MSMAQIMSAMKSITRKAKKRGHMLKEAPPRRRPKRLSKKILKRNGLKRAYKETK